MEALKKLHNDDLGKLILRIAIGGLMLFHGVSKILTGLEPILEIVKANRLPEFVAYGVYLGEVVAPVFVLLGLWTRPAALVMAINMIVAVALEHRTQIFALDKMSGAWAIELPALYFLGSVAIVFLGAGRFSFFRRQGVLD
jgi:putative oxidoreductase